MLVVLAGEVVDTAEESAAHAAGDAVVVRGVGEADLGGAGSCHELRVAKLRCFGEQLVGVPKFAAIPNYRVGSQNLIEISRLIRYEHYQ